MKLAKGAFLGRYLDGRKMYMGSAIHVANPEDSPKRWNGKCKLNSDPACAFRYGPRYTRFLFSFGVIGTTYVLVYAGSLEDGLEIAAEWLADNEMFGHITPHTTTRIQDELGCDCKDPFECEAHTYTESGWLASSEWFVHEPISNYNLRRIHRG